MTRNQLRCIGFPSDVIRTFTAQSFRLNGGNGLTGRDKDIRPQGCALAQRAKAGPSEQTLVCQSRGFLKTVNVRYEFAFFREREASSTACSAMLLLAAPPRLDGDLQRMACSQNAKGDAGAASKAAGCGTAREEVVLHRATARLANFNTTNQFSK